MATTKPRISVTLNPETYDELRALAAINRQSLSAVIGGLLDAVVPTVHRVVEVGRRFQSLSEGMQAQVTATFEDAEAEIAPALRIVQDRAFSALAAVEEAIQDPRPVTRGSRPPLKSVSTGKSGPAR